MAEERPVDALLPIVYEELRRLAAAYLRRERPGQTLQPTALVHEAYLRLMKDRPDRWQNRAHFCAIAAHSMRQILIERARARGAQKRGGAQPRVTLDEALVAGDSPVDRSRRARRGAGSGSRQIDAEQARLVELRFFGGLTIEETAEAMNISPATVKRHWTVARAWLARELGGDGPCDTRTLAADQRAVPRRARAASGAHATALLDRTAATDAGARRAKCARSSPSTSRRPVPRRAGLGGRADARLRRDRGPWRRARRSARTASSAKSAAAAWASSTRPKTRGCAARSR